MEVRVRQNWTSAIRFALAIGVLGLTAMPASLTAQDRLGVHQPVSGELATRGAVYVMSLASSDYVRGSITQQGPVSLTVYLPGGGVLRRFPAPAGDGTRQFAFVSEIAGSYRIEASSQANRSARFELVIDRGTDATVEHNWMAKEFVASPKLPLRFYMDSGTFEAPRGPNVVRVLVSSRHLRDVLLAKGYEVRHQQFAGGHDHLNWRGTLADGLVYLVGTGLSETGAAQRP